MNVALKYAFELLSRTMNVLIFPPLVFWHPFVPYNCMPVLKALHPNLELIQWARAGHFQCIINGALKYPFELLSRTINVLFDQPLVFWSKSSICSL